MMKIPDERPISSDAAPIVNFADGLLFAFLLGSARTPPSFRRMLRDSLFLMGLGFGSAWADARKECADWVSTPTDRSIEVCSTIVRSDSEAAGAYVNRGGSGDSTDKSDLDRAIAYYDKAIETNPRSAFSYNGRAAAYDRKGDPDRALADYTRAIEIDPRYAWAYNNRGSTYERKSDLDRALSDYTKAIEIDAKFAYAYNNRGNIHRAKGDLDRALADHSKAIEINPKYAWAYNNRGDVFKIKGDLGRALADYTKAIEINPKYARAYMNRGKALDAQGNHDLALADYTKAVELEPNNAGSLRALALARFDGADFKGAARDLSQFLKLKDDAYGFAYLYISRARLGEKPEAELETNAGRLKQKAWPLPVLEMYLGKRSPAATLEVASNPEEICEAQFYIGQWHVLSGNRAEARPALQAAADRCPKTFIEYSSAMAELERLK